VIGRSGDRKSKTLNHKGEGTQKARIKGDCKHREIGTSGDREIGKSGHREIGTSEIGDRKSKTPNHRGHPFDFPFASSGSLRAGCGTDEKKPFTTEDTEEHRGREARDHAESATRQGRGVRAGSPRSRVTETERINHRGAKKRRGIAVEIEKLVLNLSDYQITRLPSPKKSPPATRARGARLVRVLKKIAYCCGGF
jgi:hypothetical protein